MKLIITLSAALTFAMEFFLPVNFRISGVLAQPSTERKGCHLKRQGEFVPTRKFRNDADLILCSGQTATNRV
jgi:hypothetical protein